MSRTNCIIQVSSHKSSCTNFVVQIAWHKLRHSNHANASLKSRECIEQIVLYRANRITRIILCKLHCANCITQIILYKLYCINCIAQIILYELYCINCIAQIIAWMTTSWRRHHWSSAYTNYVRRIVSYRFHRIDYVTQIIS